MYLIERIIGQLTYLLLLIITIYFLLHKSEKKLSRILFIYTIFLSLIAFLFVPNRGSDLYRLIPIMNLYSNTEFSEFILKIKSSSTPISELYLYTIGKVGINGLLPAITCFLYYNNLFYILKRSIERYKVSKQNIVLIFLYMMASGNFMQVITGIRTMLAFSFIAVCYYDEFIEKKSIWKNIHIYILACLLHSTSFILLFFRIIFLFIEKNNSLSKYIFKLIFILIIFLASWKYSEKYILAMYKKGVSYFTLGIYSYFWEYLIAIILLIVIIFIVIMSLKINKNKEIRELRMMLITIITFLILVSFEYNTFQRFTMFLHIISTPILVNLLNKSHGKIRIQIKHIIFYSSIFILIIACIRGNLSSLKFFIL